MAWSHEVVPRWGFRGVSKRPEGNTGPVRVGVEGIPSSRTPTSETVAAWTACNCPDELAAMMSCMRTGLRVFMARDTLNLIDPPWLR